MKKLLSVLLAFSLIAVSAPLYSALRSDNFIYSENDDGTVSITGYTDFYTTELIIPAEIDGKSVTKIGASTFRSKTAITSAVVPDSVIEIGGLAFYGCSNLASILIGNSVKAIGGNCFNLCKALTSIDLKNTETIGEFAFYGCTELTSLNCGASLTIIPTRAFSGCKKLADIAFSGTLKTIGDYAFANCPAITALTFPDSLESIGNSAFVSSTTLASVTFGSGNLAISGYAFENCPALTAVTLPKNISSIGRNAFALRDEVAFSHNIAITCNAHSAAVGYCFSADINPYITELGKTVLLGDVDGKGKSLTTIDARLALQAAADLIALTGEGALLADVNGDGYYSIEDARGILQKATGIAVTF